MALFSRKKICRKIKNVGGELLNDYLLKISPFVASTTSGSLVFFKLFSIKLSFDGNCSLEFAYSSVVAQLISTVICSRPWPKTSRPISPAQKSVASETKLFPTRVMAPDATSHASPL
jgi:hypothetical protein